jgi:hypothetical protein
MQTAQIRLARRLYAEATELRAIWSRRADVAGQPNAPPAETEETKHRKLMARYIGKPSLYAKEVLGVEFWSVLATIADDVEKPPYRTNVKSGHKLGKNPSRLRAHQSRLRYLRSRRRHHHRRIL